MHSDEPLSFNLIDRPWVRVRQLDGHVTGLSIMDAFAGAHRIAGVVGDVPTQTFAITRLLLAILHSAIDGPRDLEHWDELWAQHTLPIEHIGGYLDAHRGRFDLFDPHQPFFQVADLHTGKGEVSELSKLIADVPNGHPFLTSRLGPIASLSFAEAARWLVHCQAFDPSGIKSGAVGDDRVKGGRGYPIGVGWSGLLGGVLPEGASLRETLLLNLIARDFDDGGRWARDAPVWERPHLGPAAQPPSGRAPLGPRDLYTWQSRRIRLVREHDQVGGVLICNGDRLTPQNLHHIEPHTAWRRSKPQEKKLGRPLVYMPREHEPQRAIWRGLQSLLPGAAKPQDGEAATAVSPIVLEWVGLLSTGSVGPDHRMRVRTVGMVYGGQSATTADIIDDTLDLRSVLLRPDATDLAGVAVSAVTAAESAARALGTLAGNLAVASGRAPEAASTRATELAYAELDVSFRSWIATLRPDSDPTRCKADWHSAARATVQALADELIERAPASAWIGRTVNGRQVTSSHADIWFRADLRRSLPLAYLPTDTPAPA
jgi:CRISPR system Cascade subunit CasA